MTTHRRAVWQKGWGLLAAAGLAMGLSACGGDGDPPKPGPPTGPTVTPCAQEALFQDNGVVTALTFGWDDFSVPRTGRLDITLDWTNDTSPVGFYLTPVNTCTPEEFNARTCNFLIRSEPSTVKPRLISEPIDAGNYRWIIANYSDEQESMALQIVLSTGECAPLAGSRPSGSSREDGGAWPALRAQHN